MTIFGLSTEGILYVIYPLYLVFVPLAAVFLFWRAGRQELYDSDFLFDATVIFTVGALVFGRIVDFLVRSDFYQWSFARLIFFNVYTGVDFWGALVGAVLAIAIYLRQKKKDFWPILDLAAAPSAFGLFLAYFGQLMAGWFFASGRTPEGYFNWLYFPITYFLIYLALKRLEVKKRHEGFFGCFFITSVAAANLLFWLLGQGSLRIFKILDYFLIAPLVFLIVGSVVWYLRTKRKPVNDLKVFMALILLVLLGFKRILTDIREADSLAKKIILLPYYLAIALTFLVKLVGREFLLGLTGIANSFGMKK